MYSELIMITQSVQMTLSHNYATNDVILEQQITIAIIDEFTYECDINKKAPRLLSLLWALCASQNGPIM